LLGQAQPLRIERPIEREDEIFAAGFELARFESLKRVNEAALACRATPLERPR
jgi:hypothetical protein